MRGLTSLYVEYANGDKEYHDLPVDPDELRNSCSSLSGKKQDALHTALDAMGSRRGTESCSAAARQDHKLTQR